MKHEQWRDDSRKWTWKLLWGFGKSNEKGRSVKKEFIRGRWEAVDRQGDNAFGLKRIHHFVTEENSRKNKKLYVWWKILICGVSYWTGTGRQGYVQLLGVIYMKIIKLWEPERQGNGLQFNNDRQPLSLSLNTMNEKNNSSLPCLPPKSLATNSTHPSPPFSEPTHRFLSNPVCRKPV